MISIQCAQLCSRRKIGTYHHGNRTASCCCLHFRSNTICQNSFRCNLTFLFKENSKIVTAYQFDFSIRFKLSIFSSVMKSNLNHSCNVYLIQCIFFRKTTLCYISPKGIFRCHWLSMFDYKNHNILNLQRLKVDSYICSRIVFDNFSCNLVQCEI